jgi:hypothetical protein
MRPWVEETAAKTCQSNHCCLSVASGFPLLVISVYHRFQDQDGHRPHENDITVSICVRRETEETLRSQAEAYKHSQTSRLLALITDLLQEVRVIDFDSTWPERFGQDDTREHSFGTIYTPQKPSQAYPTPRRLEVLRLDLQYSVVNAIHDVYGTGWMAINAMRLVQFGLEWIAT